MTNGKTNQPDGLNKDPTKGLKSALANSRSQSRPAPDQLDKALLKRLENWIDSELSQLISDNPQWQTISSSRKYFGR